MILLEGKSLSQKILSDVQLKISTANISPRLEIIIVGSDAASLKYVALKAKKAQEIGIIANINSFDQNSSTQSVVDLINQLNLDSSVHGIMVQLPLPPTIDKYQVLNTINPSKDVDGLTATSLGNLYQGNDCHVSATPLAVIKLLSENNITVGGKNAVILSRSSLIGLPLFALLTNLNATVTVCHDQTPDIKQYTQNADIIISAISKSKYLNSEYIKDNAVVVDISVNIDQNGSMTGDFDFDSVAQKVSAITPVPGGVGPVTIACLLENTFTACIDQNELK